MLKYILFFFIYRYTYLLCFKKYYSRQEIQIYHVCFGSSRICASTSTGKKSLINDLIVLVIFNRSRTIYFHLGNGSTTLMMSVFHNLLIHAPQILLLQLKYGRRSTKIKLLPLLRTQIQLEIHHHTERKVCSNFQFMQTLNIEFNLLIWLVICKCYI